MNFNQILRKSKLIEIYQEKLRIACRNKYENINN